MSQFRVVILRRVFDDFLSKLVIWLELFLAKVVTLLGVCEGHVTKSTCFFSAAGRRGTDRKTDRTEWVLFHIEVRTLYARRMFREK